MKYIKIAVPDDFDPKIHKLSYPINEGWDLRHVEVWEPQYRDVLDKGYVGLVDFMGDDQTVVDAARMSYGKGTRRVNEDRALIRYLIRNRHWTPVEMVEIMWHVKAPIFVFRQWHRHRTASINEYSARYSVMTDDIYMPDPSVLKPQSALNKQGRDGDLSDNNIQACLIQLQHAYTEATQAYKYLLGDTVDPSMTVMQRRNIVEDFAINLIRKLEDTHEDWMPEKVTEEMIEEKIREVATANGLFLTDDDFHQEGHGLARELARIVMPLGTYSEMYWKSNLRNTFNFLGLRADPHAQYEIGAYAKTMLDMLEPIAPVCVAGFIDYQLQGRSFSRMELDVIRKMYSIAADGDNSVANTIEETMLEAGAGKREIREFIKALEG